MSRNDYMDTLKKFIEEDMKNTNELFEQYGDTDDYKKIRANHFTPKRKFKYSGIKYEVVKTDGEYVWCKRLGFTFKREPSGRKKSRYLKFGLTSTMDMRLEFIS